MSSALALVLKEVSPCSNGVDLGDVTHLCHVASDEDVSGLLLGETREGGATDEAEQELVGSQGEGTHGEGGLLRGRGRVRRVLRSPPPSLRRLLLLLLMRRRRRHACMLLPAGRGSDGGKQWPLLLLLRLSSGFCKIKRVCLC
jgi:hypothetical protein